MMIAAVVAAALHHRRAAEFAAPEHERVVEQPALLQVLAPGRRRPDRCPCSSCVRSFVEIAVLVPDFVEQLHEAHAALDQSPGQQAIVGERRLARLGAVHVENVLRLLGEVHQLRGAGLHAIGHLERVDARGDFGIADHVETLAVELGSMASSESRWTLASTPRGLDRYSTGSPLLRNGTPL